MTKTRLKTLNPKSVTITEEEACKLSEECGFIICDCDNGDNDQVDDNNVSDNGFKVKAYFSEYSPYGINEKTGFPGSSDINAANIDEYRSNTAKLAEKLKYVDTVVYLTTEIKQNANQNAIIEGNGYMNATSDSYTTKAEDAGKIYIFDCKSALMGVQDMANPNVADTDAQWFVDNKDLISEGYLSYVGDFSANSPDDMMWELGFGNLRALANYNDTPITKILGIGSYELVRHYSYQDGWVAAVNNPQVFADSVNRLVTEFKLDGVDLGWGPLSFIITDPKTSKDLSYDFISLTKVLRDTLGEEKVISFPITVDTTQIEEFAQGACSDDGKNCWEALVDYVDEIGVIAYDMENKPEGSYNVATLHSITYPNDCNSLQLPDCDPNQFNADSAVKKLIEFGVPAEKISVGYPSYGRGLELQECGDETQCYGVPHQGANLVKAFGISSYTWLMNRLENDKSVEEHLATVDHNHEPFANGAYVFFDDEINIDGNVYPIKVFYSYDNVETVTARANYAVENGLKGVFTYLIENDTSDDHSLVKAAHDVLHASERIHNEHALHM